MPTPLHAAIRAGDEREALRHVGLGAVVVRVFDDEGNTPLGLAAARGQLTLVGTLLDAHARVNARDAGDKSAAKALAEAWRATSPNSHGTANPWEPSARPWRPALREGTPTSPCLEPRLAGLPRERLQARLTKASLIAPEGAPTGPRARDALAEREAQCLAAAGPGASLNRTPLACAVREGQYAAAELLLERGAHRDVVDHLGLSPLAIAVQRNDAECAGLLIEGRARPGTRGAGTLAVDAALLDAAFHRPQPVMAALMEGRLGPRALSASLVHAASTLDLAGAQVLLEGGVSPDARGYGGWSALGAAISSAPSDGAPHDSPGAMPPLRRHELVRLRVLMVNVLLDAGASPDTPAHAGESPRAVAIRSGAPAEVIERL